MTTTSRSDERAAFYTANADRLLATLTRRIGNAPRALLEDACQTAWTILLRRPDIELSPAGYAWLIVVASHEALRPPAPQPPWRGRRRGSERGAGAGSGCQRAGQTRASSSARRARSRASPSSAAGGTWGSRTSGAGVAAASRAI